MVLKKKNDNPQIPSPTKARTQKKYQLQRDDGFQSVAEKPFGQDNNTNMIQLRVSIHRKASA